MDEATRGDMENLIDTEHFIIFYDEHFSDCFRYRNNMRFTYEDLKNAFLAGRKSVNNQSPKTDGKKDADA